MLRSFDTAAYGRQSGGDPLAVTASMLAIELKRGFDVRSCRSAAMPMCMALVLLVIEDIGTECSQQQ